MNMNFHNSPATGRDRGRFPRATYIRSFAKLPPARLLARACGDLHAPRSRLSRRCCRWWALTSDVLKYSQPRRRDINLLV
jgi:hypothetical protein